MTKKPNILFFLSDQHSMRFIGKNGDRYVDTPCLDHLMYQGVYFENAYCQNPLCVPSRASLLTGRYSKALGIYENRHILEANCETLPRVLGRHGYATCLIGKSHFNGEQFHGYRQRPYGDLFGQGHQPEYIRTGREACEHGLEDILINSGPTAIPLAMTQTEICVSESVKWLSLYASAHQENPFFLSVHFDKPHFPLRCPEPYYRKYENQVTLPSYPAEYANRQAVEFVRQAFEVNGAWEHYGRNPEYHRQALAAYCGCVEWVDSAVGRILHALEFLGLAENTIVVYTADHGELAGEKGAWQKTVFFDASAKVPLIIRWPGQARVGQRSDTLVGLIDLFPTLCDAAQAPVPETCDGVSLAPLICEGKPTRREEIFCESVVLKVPEHAGCMIRTERYKYNYYLRGKHELYDMAADPGECVNLIDHPEYAGQASVLRQRVEAFWEPDRQMDRNRACPSMAREKHFYLYSNQFIGSDGAVFDAKP